MIRGLLKSNKMNLSFEGGSLRIRKKLIAGPVFKSWIVKLFIISIIAIVMDSCSATLAFQKGIRNYKEPLKYTYNTIAANCPKTDSLTISLVNATLDSTTTVSLVKKHMLYLLLYASRDLKMNVHLGQSSLNESYKSFFYNSIIDETYHRACFGIRQKTASDSSYALKITIDSCTTNAIYEYYIADFLGFTSINYRGTPAVTKLMVTAKLTRGNKIIEEKKYDVTRYQLFANHQFYDYKKFKSAFMSNLAESLSLATKKCIDEVIDDAGATIQEQKNSKLKYLSDYQ